MEHGNVQKRFMTSEEDIKKFRDLIHLISEFFPEYVLIVKHSEGKGVIWKSSDSTWALGALERYRTCCDEKDRFDEKQQMEDEGSTAG